MSEAQPAVQVGQIWQDLSYGSQGYQRYLLVLQVHPNGATIVSCHESGASIPGRPHSAVLLKRFLKEYRGQRSGYRFIRATQPPPPSITAQIAAQLYKAFERFEADKDLLSIIGSYGDTLDDAEVLKMLQEWNRGEKVIHERQ
jgi:hypothetical protein